MFKNKVYIRYLIIRENDKIIFYEKLIAQLKFIFFFIKKMQKLPKIKAKTKNTHGKPAEIPSLRHFKSISEINLTEISENFMKKAKNDEHSFRQYHSPMKRLINYKSNNAINANNKSIESQGTTIMTKNDSFVLKKKEKIMRFISERNSKRILNRKQKKIFIKKYYLK